MDNPILETGDIAENIVKNYTMIEQSIVSQLGLYYKNHQLNTGSAREDVWLQLFQMIVPKKFVIEHSVFIIDSYKNVSKEVDLAIIDNTYTPYIFQGGRLKFIPIEAVAAVVECKSSSIYFSPEQEENETSKACAEKRRSTLDGWCKSIMQLKTSRESITRIATGMMINGELNGKDSRAPMQTSTRPIRIFCGYETHKYIENIKKWFDFVLIADGNKEKIDVSVCSKSLYEWYMVLNHYNNEEEGNQLDGCKKILEDTSLDMLKVMNHKEEDDNVSLLTFNFQLNQLLMLINNPILFPHMAYARMFNGE